MIQSRPPTNKLSYFIWDLRSRFSNNDGHEHELHNTGGLHEKKKKHEQQEGVCYWLLSEMHKKIKF